MHVCFQGQSYAQGSFPAPQQVLRVSLNPKPLGDSVQTFDELSAAEGCLGRFQGSQVMPLIKRFIAAPM